MLMFPFTRGITFYVILVLFTILLLTGITLYLHYEEPELKKSEIIKILNSSLIIIGLIYSILTYEFNQLKNLREIRVRKSTATYEVIKEWHSSPMIDYTKKCIEAELQNDLLKKDIDTFMKELDYDINIEYRKSLIGVLNYFDQSH